MSWVFVKHFLEAVTLMKLPSNPDNGISNNCKWKAAGRVSLDNYLLYSITSGKILSHLTSVLDITWEALGSHGVVNGVPEMEVWMNWCKWLVKMILSSHLAFVQGWLIQLDVQSMAFFAPPLHHLSSLFKMCPSSASKERMRGKQTEWELRGKKNQRCQNDSGTPPPTIKLFSPLLFLLFWTDVEMDDLICCSAQTYRGKRVDQAVVTNFFCFPKLQCNNETHMARRWLGGREDSNFFLEELPFFFKKKKTKYFKYLNTHNYSLF